MARITDMPRAIEPVWIHDVTHPVGLNWFGYKGDVKLVQYALNKVMAKVPLADVSAKPTIGPMGPEYPNLAPLEVDGIFGKKWMLDDEELPPEVQAGLRVRTR
jgi:hypothetical protein